MEETMGDSAKRGRPSLHVGALVLLTLLWLMAHGVAGCPKHYQLLLSGNRHSGGGDECERPQMSELHLLDYNDNRITSAMIVSLLATGTSPALEEVPNLFDGNVNTKYLNTFEMNYVTISLYSEFCLQKYRYYTANDNVCRDPVSWTLSYSYDGSSWTTMDSRSGVGGLITTNRLEQTSLFYVQNPAPTRSPTTAAPSRSPSHSSPLVVSARASDDLTQIHVDFNKDVTPGVFKNASRTCEPEIELQSDDTGCEGEPCPMGCAFTSPSRLVISLSASVRFRSLPRLIIDESADIRALVDEQNMESSPTFADVLVQAPSNPMFPSVMINGPTFVSMCAASTPALHSVTSFVSNALTYTWLRNDVVVSNSTVYRLTLPEYPSVVKYQFRVNSWAGQFVLSDPVFVNFTSTAAMSVSLAGASQITADAPSLSLQALVSLPIECFPADFDASSITYSFAWMITNEDSGLPLNVSNIDANGGLSSALLISPPSLLEPDSNHMVHLSVITTAGVVGEAAFVVKVLPVNPVAIIDGSSTLVVPPDSMVSLSGIRSCDPSNPVFKCTRSHGSKAPSGLNGLSSALWQCTDSLEEPCFEEGGAYIESCTNTLVCDMNLTTMTGTPPYKVMLEVEDDNGKRSLSNGVTIVTNEADCPFPSSQLVECVRCASNRVNPHANVTFMALSPYHVINASEGNMSRSVIWELQRDFGMFEELAYLDVAFSLSRVPIIISQSHILQGASYVLRFTDIVRCGNDTQTLSSSIAFSVNAPPTGGSIDVSPLSGNVSTWFSIMCSDFIDADLPLSYAVYRYKDGVMFDIGAFQLDPVRQTLLPPNSTSGHTLVCVARDSLLAASELWNSPSRSGIVVDDVTADQAIDLANSVTTSVESALAQSVSPGAAISVLSTVTSILLEAGLTPEQRFQSLSYVVAGVFKVLDSGRTLSSRESQQVLGTAGLLASMAPDNAQSPASQQLLFNLANLVSQLLVGLKNEEGTMIDVDKDVVSSSTTNVASKLATSIINTGPSTTRHRNLLGSSRASPIRRFLSDANEGTIRSVRSILNHLGDVLLSGVIEGELPTYVPISTTMIMVAVASCPSLLGEELNQVVVPGSDTDEDAVKFHLPKNVLHGVTNESESKVNIIAVRFKFNVRELVKAALLDYTADPLAPAGEVEEVIALDFQHPTQGNVYHPVNLEDPIRLRIPIKFEQLPTDNKTQLACGFWDEAVSRWSSAGCNVTAASLPTSSSDPVGWLECSCNHASDYAAWQAFVSDIDSVFNPIDMKNLTTITALVVGVLIPAIVLFWLFSARMGRRKDLADARLLHLGAFVTVTARKIQLHDRQRRFFKILRTNPGFSAKELARLMREKDAVGQNSPSNENSDEHNKALYLDTLSEYLLRLVAINQALAGGLFLASLVVKNFHRASPSSLGQLMETGGQSYEITAAMLSISVILCWATSAYTAFLFIIRHSTMKRHYWHVELLVTLATGSSLAALIVPITRDPTIGVGLGLVIGGTTMVIATAFLSLGTLYIRIWGTEGKTILNDFVTNCGRGLVYEQSIISILLRFDPFLDREKRLSLFVAIIIGNLFVGSFFFMLKTSEDISLALTIGTIFLGAFIVALPVKLTIRFLFKVTSSRTGSAMDRAVQIFRVIAFTNDVHPAFANEAQRLDIEMLGSFRRFYVAKHQYKMLQEAYVKQEKTKEDLTRIAHGLAPKGTHEYWLGPMIKLNVLLQAFAAILLVVSLSIRPFSSDAGYESAYPAIQALIVLSIIACVASAVGGALLVTVKAHTRVAPRIIQGLLFSHAVEILLTLLAVSLPLGRERLSFGPGLSLLLAGTSCCWFSLAFIGPAVYIYYWCSPEIKSIRRIYRSSGNDELDNIDGTVQEEVGLVLAKFNILDRHASTRSSSRYVVTQSLVAAELETSNPVAQREVSGLASNGTVARIEDRKTGEFGVSVGIPRAVSERLHSSRLERNVSTFSRITSHGMLEKPLENANGQVTKELLGSLHNHLDACRADLRTRARKALDAWRRQNAVELSAKQLAVRSEQSVLLKLAVVLAEETGPRPHFIRQPLSDRVLVICWTILLLYYLGGLIWIAFWVLSRDTQSRQNLIQVGIQDPTQEQIAETTNAVLAAWLGNSFLAVFIGYFVAEPIVIMIRYALIPLCLRLYHGPSRKQRAIIPQDTAREDPEAQVTTPPSRTVYRCFCCKRQESQEKIEIEHYKDRTFEAAFFDFITDFIQAIS